ncbi:hypothetical protein Nepgr_030723 [Nepenthes gracilis]|uniref:GDSL esterase/lipase 7 n=1 Tax=Nepenthes gracilis TaxID=150966 RepID=A0AAD3TF43_NEPGR|nr:hypothetical protein Nepgr_030723 [Nepenthes gracilis]
MNCIRKLEIFPIIFSFIFLHFLFVEPRPLAPALYVFGDSLFDSGNNNYLPTLMKANYPPYGLNFPGGATGRFTNGRTVADFLAEYLRLPYPPPYIGPPRGNWLTGFNYASGSCGILPETGSIFGICLNLDAQINLFQLTVERQLPYNFKSKKELSKYLAKSIFIVSAGSNDYLNNYLLPYGSSQHYTPLQFSQLLIDSFFQKLQRLYNLGARKVVVFELGPIGCVPYVVNRLKYGHKEKCDDHVNELIFLFNHRLGNMVQRLSYTLKGSNFVLGRENRLGYDAIINPAKYGLTDCRNSCCRTLLNGSTCIPDLTACSDPYGHYFWDDFHPTEAIYSVLASRCINDTAVCLPLSFRQLVHV